jgi:hypothetical protein
MPRTIMIYPVIGGLIGYVGARITGVENGLLIFVIAIFTMSAVSVGCFFFNRRSGRS